MIFPIYKIKGDAGNPDNYRGITILSCFGKLFTAALNHRLNFTSKMWIFFVKSKLGLEKGIVP